MTPFSPQPQQVRLFADLYDCTFVEAAKRLRRWNLLGAVERVVVEDKCYLDDRIYLLRTIAAASKQKTV